MDIGKINIDQFKSVSQSSAVKGGSVNRGDHGMTRPEAGREPAGAEMENIASNLNNALRDINERITFSVHEKTNRIIVKVVDRDTNEVVREIPPREAVQLLEHLQDFVGMLVDESR